jgi:hypothetical protein
MTESVLTLCFIALLATQLAVFSFFYNRPDGRRAVYRAWYAWTIDLLAISSGVTIMTLSIYLLHSPWIFAVDVPWFVFLVMFVIGSWKFSIHAVKWYIRQSLKK